MWRMIDSSPRNRSPPPESSASRHPGRERGERKKSCFKRDAIRENQKPAAPARELTLAGAAGSSSFLFLLGIFLRLRRIFFMLRLGGFLFLRRLFLFFL